MTRANAAANTALSPDFQDFVASLDEHQVDAVLVGGYALGVHGVIRATSDIDFLYRRTAKNVRALAAAMDAFGAPRSVVDADALMTTGIVTQFGQPPQRIDLLNELDGVTFAAVWKGAVTIRIEGRSLRVIGLAELRKNKASTGRKKDADDVRRLDARRARSGRTPK